MLVVSELTPQDALPLRELMAYLLRPRRPKIQIRLRPYCPVHTETLMVTRKSLDGTSYFYCPHPGCRETWKGRARVV